MKIGTNSFGVHIVKSKKPAEFLGTGHQFKDGLSPSIKRNICESVEMFY